MRSLFTNVCIKLCAGHLRRTRALACVTSHRAPDAFFRSEKLKDFCATGSPFWSILNSTLGNCLFAVTLIDLCVGCAAHDDLLSVAAERRISR